MSISVLLTGGTDFLGAFIIDAIQERHPEWKLSVLDTKSPPVLKLRVEYETGDATNLANVLEIVEKFKPNVFIHSAGLVPELAGRYGRKEKDRFFNVNVGGTRNMLDAARATGVGASVWTRSCTAVTYNMRVQYKNIDESWPTSSHSLVYGESKVSSQREIQASYNR